ncbi:hypothetical protein [Stieleria tagensis]|uniref:hypothetical protein n=1 Tax=Stieleria tagensis TaxID=2956795 RepID=UPI00209B1B30|nr:hypothetical protein [Stieleria tagensis]
MLASTLIFFACWLQWTEHRGWPHEDVDRDEDESYLQRRKKSRSRVNLLIGICGVLILAATIAGVGLVFAAAWTSVALILMVIVILAGLDAYRTHRHHQEKMRQMRKRATED